MPEETRACSLSEINVFFMRGLWQFGKPNTHD